MLFRSLEWANPTGSMKDRMAMAVIDGAEARGVLAPADTVVEYTAGTTGVSLALVCAAKGYGFHAVFSDAFSIEKRRTMEAFGATVEDVASDQGRITEQLIRAMITRAGELSERPGYWWCDQLNNHDAMTGYVALGEEIWAQSRRPIRTQSWVLRSSAMLTASHMPIAVNATVKANAARFASMR